MKKQLIERLVRYTTINTRSNPDSETVPSSDIQFDLARILYQECLAIGLEDVSMDQYGIVTATLPGNSSKNVTTIGFLAHMDTADYNAVDVKPRIIENYDGKDIVLNETEGIVTKVEVFPNLVNHTGKTLIVTDGLTLLGADDKAGIAEIMSAVEYLLAHPEIEHGPVRIAFTIDEEIGTGASYFDVEGFNAEFAFTLDGSILGELEFETFNAAHASVTFKGVSVHPGTAKNQMVNVNVLISDFIAALPADERPECTEGYEGFYLVTKTQATIEDGSIDIIIRDHDKEKFDAKKQNIVAIAQRFNDTHGYQAVSVVMKDTYYNMAEVIEENLFIIDLAKQAMNNIGIQPITQPIRGGTDGSRLSFMGLPTPNLFTGGENYHGRHELAVVEDMEKACELIIEIIKVHAQAEKHLETVEN